MGKLQTAQNSSSLSHDEVQVKNDLREVAVFFALPQCADLAAAADPSAEVTIQVAIGKIVQILSGQKKIPGFERSRDPLEAYRLLCALAGKGEISYNKFTEEVTLRVAYWAIMRKRERYAVPWRTSLTVPTRSRHYSPRSAVRLSERGRRTFAAICKIMTDQPQGVWSWKEVRAQVFQCLHAQGESWPVNPDDVGGSLKHLTSRGLFVGDRKTGYKLSSAGCALARRLGTHKEDDAEPETEDES